MNFKLYKSIFARSPAGMSILDENGLIIDVNSSWEAEFGYTVQEIKKHSLEKLAGGEFLESLLNDLTLDNCWTGTINYQAKSGKKVSCRTDVFTVKEEEGGSHYILVNGEIQEQGRVAAPRMFETAEEVLEFSVEAVFAVNLDCVCTFANSSFKALLRYASNDSIEGELNVCRQLFDKEECRSFEKQGSNGSCVIYRSMEQGTSAHVPDAELKRRDGTMLPVEFWVNPILRGGDCRGAVISFLDNTLRKNIERQSEEQQKQLLLADKMKSLGIMVSGVAHEINNPNNFIMLNSQTLMDIHDAVIPLADEHFKGKESVRLGKYPYKSIRKKGRELLSGITEGSKRIERIVKKLKDFARIEAEEGFGEVNVNEAVKTSVELMQSLISKSTHYLSVKYADDLPLVKGRHQEIEQVIINLISNSCQALSGPEKKIEISTFYQGYEKSVCVMVSDEGVGISDKNLEKIMDPFFTTKREKGGTGLGLSVSYRIVRKHGGSLDFSSDTEMGTIAILTLPVLFEYGYMPGERYEFI